MSIDAKAIDDLIDFMIDRTLTSPIDPALFQSACEKLLDAGLSVLRVNMAWGTLHPTIGALTLKWWKDERTNDVIRHMHSDGESEDWLTSPPYYVLKNQLAELSIKLENRTDTYNFPLLEELAQAGGTEYVIYLIPFVRPGHTSYENDGVFFSWLSDRPGGFLPEEIDVIKRVQKHYAIALKVALRERIAQNTLTAYLGENAAERVLHGTIKLGDGEIISAVIWYSDLRKSTNLGDTLPGPELLQALNDYFACTAGAVMEHGGEVLRFVGDAVLAIFPTKEIGMAEACNQATKAARAALSQMEETNQQRAREGKIELNFGLGLHVGELMFGNIGVPERLDFSVTGPAANEAARIESMTKELNQPVLASQEFANHMSSEWTCIGPHPLRGVGRPIQLYSLKS